MLATCTKCDHLYEAVETEPLQPTHLCLHCAAANELLEAGAALFARVLSLSRERMPAPLRSPMERMGRALDRARASR